MHVTEEQLVLHIFGDDDAASAEHVAACADCQAQVQTLRDVVALVDRMPVPERGETYGAEVWNRIQWRMTSERRRKRWLAPLIAAAAIAVAFIAGLLVRPRMTTPSRTQPATATQVANNAKPQAPDKLLLYVVSDHLDSSERVLLEITNADPKRPLDVTSESKRAGELVASNRIYRQTAAQRGDTRIASVLADLEPVLVELAHSGTTLSADEVASLQRRIDSKGLLFQVRVVSAQTSRGEWSPQPKGTSSL